MTKCLASILQPQLQERQPTACMNQLVAHSDDDHFVICMYGLHNANLLWRALPHQLIAPVPLYHDRKAHHHAIAATLWVSQTAKRAITQAKRKVTLVAKKAKKLTEQQEHGGTDSDSSDDEELKGNGTTDAQSEHVLGKRCRK